MYYYLNIVLLLCLFNHCTAPIVPEEQKTPQLHLQKIKENIFLHTSYLPTESYGLVPCNGLIYLNEGEALIVDTPTNDTASQQLLNWLKKYNLQAKAVLATHFHVDCLGGLNPFHQIDIPSYAQEKTAVWVDKKYKKPLHTFKEELRLEIGRGEVVNTFFGAGHTRDNVVSWIADEKILFGGCLLKSIGAGKGNLNDADTMQWSATVAKIKATYPDAKTIIPGHGSYGDTALFNYTIELFRPQKYLFFLHNRFLENHDLQEMHPDYGKVEYSKILQAFQNADFEIISEIREGNVNARTYAQEVIVKIDSLLAKGVSPQNITVVGTSKGGYIAQYVSTLLANPKLNYVFIGSYQNSDIAQIPDIHFCGNVLNIYEKSDPYGVAAQARANTSGLEVSDFKDLQLDTGLSHGFLFKAMEQWIIPSIDWANAHSQLSMIEQEE